MSFKAFVIMDSPAEKTANMIRTLRKKTGVVSVDLVEDSQQVIMVVEAPERRRLAKLTVQAISSADRIATVLHLLTATSY